MAGAKRRRPPGPLKPERAWDYLLFLLSRRMYTTAELVEKLGRRGIEEPDAQRLIARLAELQLVDDATYTTMYIGSRSASRGRLGLRQELRRKGVAPELVDEGLAELTPEAQLSSATALLEKNAWRYRPPAPESGANRELLLKARAKAFAFLARRGFAADAVSGAIAAVGWFDDDD